MPAVTILNWLKSVSWRKCFPFSNISSIGRGMDAWTEISSELSEIRDGVEEDRENIRACQDVSEAVTPPEQAKGKAGNWGNTLAGLCNPNSCGVTSQPREVQADLPSLLFFLAMGTLTVRDFEFLWEEVWYLCPTKIHGFAFVSAGHFFPTTKIEVLFCYVFSYRLFGKIEQFSNLEWPERGERPSWWIFYPSSFLSCQLELSKPLCWCIF